MGVWSAYVFVPPEGVVLSKARGGIRIPGMGVIDSCDLPMWALGIITSRAEDNHLSQWKNIASSPNTKPKSVPIPPSIGGEARGPSGRILQCHNKYLTSSFFLIFFPREGMFIYCSNSIQMKRNISIYILRLYPSWFIQPLLGLCPVRA